MPATAITRRAVLNENNQKTYAKLTERMRLRSLFSPRSSIRAEHTNFWLRFMPICARPKTPDQLMRKGSKPYQLSGMARFQLRCRGLGNSRTSRSSGIGSLPVRRRERRPTVMEKARRASLGTKSPSHFYHHPPAGTPGAIGRNLVNSASECRTFAVQIDPRPLFHVTKFPDLILRIESEFRRCPGPLHWFGD